MPRTCCVNFCCSKGQLFPFPQETERRNLWATRCGLDVTVRDGRCLYICSAHFSSGEVLHLSHGNVYNLTFQMNVSNTFAEIY